VQERRSARARSSLIVEYVVLIARCALAITIAAHGCGWSTTLSGYQSFSAAFHSAGRIGGRRAAWWDAQPAATMTSAIARASSGRSSRVDVRTR